MMPKRLALSAIGAATLALAAPAYAQSLPIHCTTWAQARIVIEGQFQEQTVFEGGDETAVIRLSINEETGTWTVYGILPDGGACVILAGRNGVLANVPMGEDM